MRQHLLSIRVYVEDTDCFTTVYHAQHLSFMSRGREEWLRSLGYPLERRQQLDFAFLVRHIDIRYHKPAHLGDLLLLETHLLEAKRVSLKMQQTLWRLKQPTTNPMMFNQMAMLDAAKGEAYLHAKPLDSKPGESKRVTGVDTEAEWAASSVKNIGELERLSHAQIHLACVDSALKLRNLDAALIGEMKSGE